MTAAQREALRAEAEKAMHIADVVWRSETDSPEPLRTERLVQLQGFYSISVSPDVILALLDALDAADGTPTADDNPAWGGPQSAKDLEARGFQRINNPKRPPPPDPAEIAAVRARVEQNALPAVIEAVMAGMRSAYALGKERPENIPLFQIQELAIRAALAPVFADRATALAAYDAVVRERRKLRAWLKLKFSR